MRDRVRSIILALGNRTYLPTWIALFVVGASLIFAENQNRIINKQELRAEVLAEAGLIRSHLEGQLTADVQLIKGLVGLLVSEQSMTQDRFNEIAAYVAGDLPEILNIAVAPDLVVSMVYPYERNKAVLGLDYNKNDAQREAVMRMRDSGEIVLAGPVNLVQGGTGFIIRFPVFTGEGEDRAFWGMVAAVIDADALYQGAGLHQADLPVEIALSGRDGTGHQGGVFYGDPAIHDYGPMVMDVILPTGTWELAAIPRGGWPKEPGNLWKLRLVLIVAGILIIVPTFMACRLSAVRRSTIKTLRKREQELERHQVELEQLSTVAQNASDSIILSGPDLRVFWVNDAFTRMTGYTIDDAIGKRPGDLLNGPETDPETIRDIAEHIARGERLHREILNYTKDGDTIWVDTNLVPVLNENGDMRMVIGIERDVTSQKRNAVELAEAKRAAEEADRTKTEFLANMSHEIRTPMNGIIGMADLLSETALPEEQEQYVQIIRTSSKALLKIINDILDLTRMESGKLSLEPVDFDLERCIESAVDILRPVAREKGLTLNVNYATDLPKSVRADDGRVRQILVNLVGNAVKFTASGRVDVRVLRAQSDPYRLTIDVQDSGIGMSQAQLNNIFDRFSQADAATTRSFGGTGLGLTISRLLAQQMQGDITVHSEPGQGSCFSLYIQCDAPLGQPEQTDTAQEPDLDRIRGCKVLLAEDNRTNRLLIRKYLSDLTVELIEAENGYEAVELCARHRPDLILMDMSMPEMDGLTATRLIRMQNHPQPPIVALTANAFASDREACLAAGMNGFLSKPINKKELLNGMAGVMEDPDGLRHAASA